MSAPARHRTAHVHHTTTGLDSRKIAIWAFIGSECMFFVSLISTYLIYKGRSVVGPFPHEAWTIRRRGDALSSRSSTSPSRRRRRSCCSCRRCSMVLALAAVAEQGTCRSARWASGSSARRALAVDDGIARHDVPRLPGVRVHVLRARRADAPDQPVRLVLLHADRLPRRARDRRRDLAAHAARDRLQARARPEGRSTSRSPRCTGTSSTSSGSRSSRSST